MRLIPAYEVEIESMSTGHRADRNALREILIIEDDAFLADIFEQRFSNLGYQVALAEDGQAGLTKARQSHPAVILLDLMLPSLNGFKVLEALKSDATTADIPVVVVTNMDTSLTYERARNLKVDDYIPKYQFTPREIAARVEKLLKSKSHGPQMTAD